jgi:NADH-quinone oxidoreductase subunit A
MLNQLYSNYSIFYLSNPYYLPVACGYYTFFYYNEYVVFICLILFFFSKFLSFFFVFYYIDNEKLTAYECGFHPFLDTRNPFDFKFYLIAIIFLIFDLELIFIFPWAIYFESSSLLSYYTVLIFFFIVSLGLLYECGNGCLY